MSSKRELLLNAIEEMFNGSIDETRGICENIDILTNKCWLGYDCVNSLALSWSYFSGDKDYPVSGEDVWNKNFDTKSFWKGEQRELRFSLLEHLKSELLKRTEEEIEELLC